MSNREQWSGSYGFVIAAIGSAVGLGNLWRFPYLAGKNGGGAFVIIYLLLVALIGVPLLLAELSIGRHGRNNPCQAFRCIHKHFASIGGLGIIACSLILVYYGMVGGWTLYYLVDAIFSPGPETTDSFNQFAGSIIKPVFFQLLFMGFTSFIVWKGVSKGIEQVSRFMMPTLFVLLIILIVRSFTLPGAMKGITFLLMPDFSKITPEVIITAMGQVFFSLCVGCSQMVTYGSYIKKTVPISRCCWMIALCDSGVALLAGLVILPAVFAFNGEPGQGPSLLFATLPTLFGKMPGGYFFGILFFLLVVFAALSSSISILEPSVSYFIDERKYSRGKAILMASSIISGLGIICVLSMGKTLGNFTIFGANFFEFLDYLTNNIMLPVGGILTCIAVSYFWGTKNAVAEITQNGKHPFFGKAVWIFNIKYLVPFGIILIFLSAIGLF